METNRPKRVLLAKPGLDGHDRGVKVVAYALRDAGIEVIYTGLRQTPQEVANVAIQEDVDLIGLSILSGSHLGLTQKIIEKLKQEGISEMNVVVGGVIPHEDIAQLKKIGVAEVFPVGSDINWITQKVTEILNG